MHPCTLYIYLSENIYEAILRPPYKYNDYIFALFRELRFCETLQNKTYAYSTCIRSNNNVNEKKQH